MTAHGGPAYDAEWADVIAAERRQERAHIGCINWTGASHLPRAVVFVPTRDGGTHDKFFDTWAEAIEWANKYMRLYRRALRRRAER